MSSWSNEGLSASGSQDVLENLALIYQELLTVTVRLKAGLQQVQSANRFRNQILAAIQSASEKARAHSYTAEDIQLTVFAVIAFLDETILNLRQPAFEEWVRRPLQEELFGQHIAGETFFQNLDALLGRTDTRETADVLEVYQLCLLLGYLGKYSLLARAELRALLARTAEKIQRIRQTGSDLSPDWAPPATSAAVKSKDPWVFRLRIAAGSSLGLAFVLWVLYSLLLSSGTRALREMTFRGGSF